MKRWAIVPIAWAALAFWGPGAAGQGPGFCYAAAERKERPAEPGMTRHAEGWADREIEASSVATQRVVLAIVAFLLVAALALALAHRRPSNAARFR